MLGRLGQVIYWGLATLGVLLIGVAACFHFGEPQGDPLAMVAIFAATASWLIGRAALYVLAGR